MDRWTDWTDWTDGQQVLYFSRTRELMKFKNEHSCARVRNHQFLCPICPVGMNKRGLFHNKRSLLENKRRLFRNKRRLLENKRGLL